MEGSNYACRLVQNWAKIRCKLERAYLLVDCRRLYDPENGGCYDMAINPSTTFAHSFTLSPSKGGMDLQTSMF